MDLPFQNRYRSRWMRIANLRRFSVVRVLRRPMVQWTVSAVLVLAATMWLHDKTPERLGQDQMVQRAADSATWQSREG